MTLHLTPEQYTLLMAKIHTDRVSSRDGMAYVEAHDDKAHLIRIFGFGGFDSEVIEQTLIFEEPTKTNNDKPAWYVAYRSVVKLTVWDACGHSATYTEGHVGESTHPRRGEAHGNAATNSESYALKRCCVFLGDQYGLSLYNKGQRDAIVRWTLVKPPKPETEQKDATPEEPINTDDIPVVHQESLEIPDPGPDPRTTSQTPAALPPAAAGPVEGEVPPASPSTPPDDQHLTVIANEIREMALGQPEPGYSTHRWLAHVQGTAVKRGGAAILKVPVESSLSPTQVALKVFLEECLKGAMDREREARAS